MGREESDSMSNVFRRNQKSTGLEFWDNAQEIEIFLTRFLMNEKNVPKKYRYVYSIPILNSVRVLQRYIVAANTIYPVDETELNRRREEQQKAINANEVIIQEIQRMVLVLPIDVDKLDMVGQRLLRESALLRAWRKSSKIKKDKAASQAASC